MAPIQNSRISEVKIACKDSGALIKSLAAVYKEWKLISTRSAFAKRIRRKVMNETARKIIDPLFCNRIGPALVAVLCRGDDGPLSVFKLVWLSVNGKSGFGN